VPAAGTPNPNESYAQIQSCNRWGARMGHILRRRELQAMGHPWLGFRRAAALCRRAAAGAGMVGCGGEARCGRRQQRGSVWEAARLGVRGRQRRRAHSRVARVWAAGLFPFRAVGERGRGGVYSEGFFSFHRPVRALDYTLSSTLELLARLGYADTYCVYKCLPTVLVSPEQCRQLICSHTTSLPTDYMTSKGCTITNR